VAFRAALQELARDRAIVAHVAAFEPILADLEEDDRLEYGVQLSRVAIPALGVDVDLMKDEGWRFVAPTRRRRGGRRRQRPGGALAHPPADDRRRRPRVATRRFLGLVAEQVEIELPVAAATLDALLDQPVRRT